MRTGPLYNGLHEDHFANRCAFHFKKQNLKRKTCDPESDTNTAELVA